MSERKTNGKGLLILVVIVFGIFVAMDNLVGPEYYITTSDMIRKLGELEHRIYSLETVNVATDMDSGNSTAFKHSR